MGGLSSWWRSLQPTQRALIAVGVPLAAVAAIVSARRGGGSATSPSDATKAASATTAQYLAAPTVADGGGEDVFDALKALKDYVDEVVPTTGQPTDPATAYSAMPTHELFNACHATGGATAVVAELLNRQTSINDPRWKTGSPCLKAGILYYMSQGIVPPPGKPGAVNTGGTGS